MIDLAQLNEIVQPTQSKIIFLVVDGLGGLPHPESGKSELETAQLPNLDRIAKDSACGLTTPVLPGITPGSGPGHLSLFGYNPLKYEIGRGVLEALGVGVDLKPGDVAARGNFCTVDRDGLLVDRRAGRIPTDQSLLLCQKLNSIELDDISLTVYPVQDHRFVLVMNGQNLSEEISGTDPQVLGVPPRDVKAITPKAQKTANSANAFIRHASKLLQDENQANMVLLRGFSQLPTLPSINNAYGLNSAAIAAYPMYRGLAQLLGMQVIQTGSSFQQELTTLYENYQSYNFFFLHYKPADAAGEDGNFSAKVEALEQLDGMVPQILSLNPDVLVIAGDHSTPAVMASHSWHEVPFLVNSQWTIGGGIDEFTELACRQGSIGRIPASTAMLLTLAHAGKLSKYGP